jgi:hypothetical protein
METAAFARNGRTVVPIFYVAQAMDIKVTYDRGLIILDSEKIYDLSADKKYIDGLIEKLSGLPTVGSAEKFNALMKDLAAAEQNQGREMIWEQDSEIAFSLALDDAVAVPPIALQPDAPETAPATGADRGDYSTTNIQVAGVDEADIIKTDGLYIYHLTGGMLNIIQTDGSGQMRQICVLDLQKQANDFYA